MNPKTSALLAASTALALSSAAFAQERVLTLDEVVRMALDTHPAVDAARLDVEVAREGEGVALAGFLPKVTFDGSYARATGNFASRPGQDATAGLGATVRNSATTYDWFNFGATLTQPIWDFGRTLGSYRAAQQAVKGAEQGVASSRLDVWTRVVQAYYGVLASQRLLEVATRTRDQARRHMERADALYKAGARPRLDMVRAVAEAEGAEAGLRVARERLDLARSVLLTAAGQTERFAFTVAPLDAGAGLRLPDLDAAVASALAGRPERARLEVEVKIAEANVTRALGAWLPSVAAGASVTDGGTQIKNLAWNYSVGVGLNWPLFDGLANWRGHRAAKAGLEAVKARLRELDLAVRAEVEQARTRVMEAGSRLEPLRAASAAAAEAMRLAEERYRAGEGTAVDVLDARRGMAEADSELVRAQYDLGLAWTALHRALGTAPVAEAPPPSAPAPAQP